MSRSVRSEHLRHSVSPNAKSTYDSTGTADAIENHSQFVAAGVLFGNTARSLLAAGSTRRKVWDKRGGTSVLFRSHAVRWRAAKRRRATLRQMHEENDRDADALKRFTCNDRKDGTKSQFIQIADIGDRVA